MIQIYNNFLKEKKKDSTFFLLFRQKNEAAHPFDEQPVDSGVISSRPKHRSLPVALQNHDKLFTHFSYKKAPAIFFSSFL